MYDDTFVLINKSVFSEFTSENTSYSWRNGEAIRGERRCLIFQFKNNRHAFSPERVFHEDSRNQIRLIGVTATSRASQGCRIIVFLSFLPPVQNSLTWKDKDKIHYLLTHAEEPIIVYKMSSRMSAAKPTSVNAL